MTTNELKWICQGLYSEQIQQQLPFQKREFNQGQAWETVFSHQIQTLAQQRGIIKSEYLIPTLTVVVVVIIKKWVKIQAQ